MQEKKYRLGNLYGNGKCFCTQAIRVYDHDYENQIMDFAKLTGLSVIVCHYAPYCSKWNPIEHRLFSQMTMEGVVFSDCLTIKALKEKTSTKKD